MSVDIDSLSTNIEDLHKQLNEHINHYELRQREQDIRLEAIQNSLSSISSDMKPIVDAWTTATGIQKFLKWLSGFGLLLILIIWVVDMAPSIVKAFIHSLAGK